MSDSRFPLGVLLNGIAGGGTPSKGTPGYWNGDIPWASVKDFEDSKFLLEATQDTITKEGLENSSSRLVPAGTPLLCTRMAVGRASMTAKPTAINQDIKALYPDEEKITAAYLIRALHFQQERLERISVGSTVKGITLDQIRELSVYAPPVEEQKAIAAVLDTLDDAIQATEALLRKQTLVKEGLLQDLLTRGVDENGRLRPRWQERPEQYKNSALWTIPKRWQVVRLDDVCEHITKGSTPTTFGHGWVEEGILFLRSECVSEHGFAMSGSEKITPEAHKSMARSAIKGGDILMTITGYIGRTCRYPTEMPEANINQHIARIRIASEQILYPDYAVWALKDPRQTKRLELEVTGLAYPQIGLLQVQNILLVLPPLEEQKSISKTLDAHEDRIQQEKKSLEKLRRLKSGLMQDLLTGDRRVTPALMEQVATLAA